MRTLGGTMAEQIDRGVATRVAPAGLEDAAKRALAWAHSARFLVTASRLEELPVGELPEIAFVGRSNAGKSSAINALTQQRNLAFASKTPGRTQHINLFTVGPKDRPDALFVDLPGYGYAAVAREAKVRWQQVMADYLEMRRSLEGLVMLVDARLGATDLDSRLLEFVAPRVRTGAVNLLVLLTKIDKLNPTQATKALAAAERALANFATDASDIAISTFSAPKRTGVADVAVALYGWVRPASDRVE